MIKAIIFDFGGVITPIEPWDGWTPTSEERKIIKEAVVDIAEKFAPEFKRSEFDQGDFEREFRKRTNELGAEAVEKIIKSLCTPNESLLNLISELCLKYKVYGLVNAPFGWTEVRRGIHKLDKYFARVFVSYEIDVRKPDPKIFQYLLENTDLAPEECLFVDDKEENVLAAKQLGMEGYVFDSTENFANHLKIFDTIIK